MEDNNNNDAAAAEQAQEASSSSSSSSSLRQLLTALAAGARAVQGLPTTTTSTSTARDDDNDNDTQVNNNNNQFAFESSFPEFSIALQQTTGTLMETITLAFSSLNGNMNEGEEEGIQLDTETSNSMMQDPLFWEQCADACDLLVEQVEAYLEGQENINNDTTAANNNNMNTWKQWSVAARNQSETLSYNLLQQRLVDMEKPQITFNITPPIENNSRLVPFIPRISYADEKNIKKPHGIVPLDLTLHPGHGLETAGFNNSATTTSSSSNVMTNRKKSSYYYLPDDIVAPLHHVPHLYATEIQQFQYQPWQLKKPAESSSSSSSCIPILDKLTATWIDTPHALQELHDKLMMWSSSSSSSSNDNNNSDNETTILELAMDLEAHSFRSFAGLVCLIQISIRKTQHQQIDQKEGNEGQQDNIENYLIDTLKLHDYINAALSDILVNPRIVKVMHGADSDIIWLQRDFGLYIVNLFDTGRAARTLNLVGGASYANLLRTFVFNSEQNNIKIDKSHQLSDWRQRPLPYDMQQYAIQDTHYLLDIAQQLRIQLYNQSGSGGNSNLLQQVLDTSRQVCLIRYVGEPFKPSGYLSSIILPSSNNNNNNNNKRGNNNNKTVQLEWTTRQQAVCKALWDWRDATARRLDESIPYICSNRLLARLAMAMPTTVHQVQNIIMSSSSPNHGIHNGIMQQQLAPAVVQCIQQAIDQFEEDENNKNNNNRNEEGDEENEEIPVAPTTTAATTTQNVQSSSSAFFKPSSASKDRQRRGMMSPVLGTEALYKQAGWMTPQEHNERLLLRAEEFTAMTTTTSTSDDDGEAVDEDDDDEDDDDEDDDEDDDNKNKPRRLLSIQTCNKNFNTKRLAEHRLELLPDSASGDADGGNVTATTAAAPTTPSRGRTVDGMATVRAAREAASQSPIRLSAMEQDAKQARQASAEIRTGLHKGGPIPAVLGLLSSTAAATSATATASTTTTTPSKHGQASGVEGVARTSASKTTAAANTEMEEEEFVIPRSMREIYKISNRNRRNKKASSPTPGDRGVTPTSEKEREELAKAEALLKERGFEAAGYLFDNNDNSINIQQQQPLQLHTSGSSSPGKRAKTKSGRESEESVPQEATGGAATKEDLDFMRGIGWIGSHQTDDSILAQRYASNAARAESTATTPGGCGGDEASTATRPTSRSEEGSHRPASSASGYTNYDYSQVGPIGAMQPPSTATASFVVNNNPFFSGSASGRSSTSPALQGGPLNQNLAKAEGGQQQQQQQRSSRKSGGSNNNNATNRGGGGKQANRKQQERPEKKDGRTHAYRSKKP